MALKDGVPCCPSCNSPYSDGVTSFVYVDGIPYCPKCQKDELAIAQKEKGK